MNARAFSTCLAVALLAAALGAQLPPISWTCPMHPDVLEDKTGACSICGMDLEPVRLVSMWTCPVHAVVEEAKPGKCRICRRDLVTQTAALTWTCASARSISQLEPTKCVDGSAMVARYTRRPHGDHNPKHGGLFFMAPDNWHHVEGAYPAPGRFRLFIYDDYSKPLAVGDARKVRGRIVTKEAFDEKAGTTRELASVPLVLARNGAFFEARLDNIALPAQMTAKISFKSEDKESRFDFAFTALSKDQSVAASPTAAAAPTAPGSASTPAAAPAADTATLLDDLRARRLEVESLVKSGGFGALYVPALQAKDLALEIQGRRRAGDQPGLEAQVKEVVLSAYLLDSYGDLGDANKIQDAYRRFSAAVSALDSLMPGR